MSDEDLFADLSERLRIAQLSLRSAAVDDATKATLAQRLIAITNSAKHDLRRASERLQAWESEVADLDTSPSP